MQNLRAAIESFVGSSQRPALSEPGEEIIEIENGNLILEEQNGQVLLQAWNNSRNVVRRVTGIESATKAKLTLGVERFGRKKGQLSIVDLKRGDAESMGRRAARLEFREVFRRFLRRTYPGWKVVEVSTDPNLEQSLSSVYPRALLQHGNVALAAIGVAQLSPVDSALSAGLIWLDYVRRRDPQRPVQGLALFLPQGQEKTTALRIRYLDPAAATYALFVHDEEGRVSPADLADYGNVETGLEPCRAVTPSDAGVVGERLAATAGVETAADGSATLSFRVHGLEFARYTRGVISWGLETKRSMHASNVGEIEALARELVHLRSADAEDHHHPLYTRNPERWLESRVRAQIEQLDPTLCEQPIYGQVPALAAADRGLIDLLAVDRTGRLAVIELKASADIDLPCQALDYWIRVKWHLDRSEFSGQGYFPGMELRAVPPRLLLVGPALEYHPSNERVLRFFSPQVGVECLAVGVDWRKQLKLMYRM